MTVTNAAPSPQKPANKQHDSCCPVSQKIIEYGLFVATAITAIATAVVAWDTHNTSIRQLRAYVIVDKAQIEGTTPQKELVLGFDIANVGQTPVYNLNFNLFIDLRPYPNLGYVTFNHIEYAAFFGKVLPNHGTTSRAFTDDELIKIETAGSERLYFIGRLTYQDIFKIERETGFCMMYLGKAKGFAYCDREKLNYGI